MIGAKDLAFPKLNLASWYIYMIGAAFTTYAVVTGGLDTGWTFYTPFSTTASTTAVVPAAVGIFVTGFSSILTGLNFIVTIHRMRAPGMTWFRLPLFIWSHYATSLIMVLGTPVLAITILLVAAERILKFGIFDPALGGDPVLFQHLFWFYSHPAVYIMVLPAMGVVSELIAAFCRKQIFGYTFVAFASLGIAVLGFLVWGHHMFVAGQSVYAALIFSLLSFLVAIPSAIKVFNWTATMYKGAISWETPMLYAIGFIGLFTIGGLTGLFLAAVGLDVHVTDTYFIVAHFHYIMVGGTIMGYLGGLHYWWPKISGRMYNEVLAKVSAVIIFVGFNLTFFPQFILGYLGMPRRYHAYPDEFQVLNVLSSAGASILGVGYLIPMVYLAWSLRYGRIVNANPWGAVGLEWTTTSPPPTENFADSAGRDLGRVRLSDPGGGSRCLTRRRHAAHHPALAHHFETLEQQKEASTLGMWVFLVTEVLFFGGLFVAYSIYRAWYPDAFAAASHSLDITLGAVNTVVLITSSLTMALAVHAAQTGDRSEADAVSRGHDGARRRVPRHQGCRVRRQVRAPPRAGAGLPLRAGRARPRRADLLLALLRDDRPARAPHDHRARDHDVDASLGVDGPDHARVREPDRDQRPLLALRGHRVDLPVSAALPAREARLIMRLRISRAGPWMAKRVAFARDWRRARRTDRQPVANRQPEIDNLTAHQ